MNKKNRAKERRRRRNNKQKTTINSNNSAQHSHSHAKASRSRFTCNNFWWHHHFFLYCPSFNTFGKSRMWFASSSSSSKLLEYRKMSSGTLGSEQCRLSTNSTCRLHPLKIGMHLNIVEYFLLTTLQAL